MYFNKMNKDELCEYVSELIDPIYNFCVQILLISVKRKSAESVRDLVEDLFYTIEDRQERLSILLSHATDDAILDVKEFLQEKEIDYLEQKKIDNDIDRARGK